MKKILTILMIFTLFLFASCATISSISKENITENSWVNNTETWQATPNESKSAQMWVDILMDYDAIKFSYENSYSIVLKNSWEDNWEGTWVNRYTTDETTPFSVYSNGQYVSGTITTTWSHKDTYSAVNQMRTNKYNFLKGFDWKLPKDVKVIYINEKNVKDYYSLAKQAYSLYYDVGYHKNAYWLGQYLLFGWIHRVANRPTLPKDLKSDGDN